MLCRIQHIGGRGTAYLSLSDFTLAPGFTSPDFELADGSPEAELVEEWVQEGLVKILPPSSTGKPVGAGGRTRGQTMTAEEAREFMANKSTRNRRKRLSMSRSERTMATHKAPIGMPFGPGRNARILSAEDLKDGKPSALPPAPPPDSDRDRREVDERSPKILNQADLAKKGEHIESGSERAGTGAADHSGAQAGSIAPGSEGGKVLDLAGARAANKAAVEPVEDEEKTAEELPETPQLPDAELPEEEKVEEEEETPVLPEDEEEEINEEQAKVLMGDQPVDNVILDHLVGKLEDMNKDPIIELAEKAGIELPQKINKAPLIKLVAEELAKKGYTELPGGDE